ncbi:hypothetical protein Vadar_016646 [Vaccinium darrowii]|uniref:Uncharacterized protein n=1 Tax=Vaccinium darrowii TaxID=229202 RepID=A0ACB7XAP1_9ERIC|nr:hypothetical protein Vadar_016646 [Vaccinium darrowii]
MDSGIRVDPMGTSGGLALFWKGTTSVSLKKMCSWFIDVEIFDISLSKSWRLVNVYFSPYENIRREQWDFFTQYNSCLGEDWVLWGDMNDILCAEEKNGGVVRPSWSFHGFQNFIDECGLVDLGFSGYPFTWRNNRNGADYVQERLDRVLVTPSWHLLYGQASVTHVETVGSDHNAILLNRHTSPVHSRVPFRFDGRWVDDDEVE